MWAIRSRAHTLKLSFTQCPIQLLRCQRQLTCGIDNHIGSEDATSKPMESVTSANNHNNIIDSDKFCLDATNQTDTRKTTKAKSRQRKRQLSRKLQERVAKHISRSSPIEPKFPGYQRHGTAQVVTVDETKEDLDDSWTPMNSNSNYERIYPKTAVPVPRLEHGLERTLFKRGVHLLIDSSSKRHNFTPFLENITQPDDFDYEAIQPYRTSSKDKNLIAMAKEQNARYLGSTSSLSGVLSQLYFKISNHRSVDTSFLSKGFDDQPNQHTRGSRVPKTILLRWKDGVYAVDADKSFDTGDTVLSHLGKSMEKVLTMKPSDYERYLKKNSSAVTEEERNAPEAFAYGRIGDLFLRSQLDCYHRDLPLRTFDLKTRATMPIRLDIPHYQDYYNYKLEQNHGIHYSFEREYYDMMRSAFLKYSFQVRIGHMDGIMVTYHNTDKIFGFQYISRSEMDSRLFGTSKMGDESFKHCLNMMQTVFNKATTQYPKQTLRMTFDASRPSYDNMRIFVEPVTEEEEKRIDDMDNDTDHRPTTIADVAIDDPIFDAMGDQVTMYRLYTTSYLNGKKIQGPVSVNKVSDTWDVYYKLEEETSIPKDTITKAFRRVRYNQATIFLPLSEDSPKFLESFKLKRRLPHQKDDGDTLQTSNPTLKTLSQFEETDLLKSTELLVKEAMHKAEIDSATSTTTPNSASVTSDQ